METTAKYSADCGGAEAMTEKSLYKMKISDLLFDAKLQGRRVSKFTEEHEYELKQWAIAVVKNCDIDVYCGQKMKNGKIARCETCQRFIDRFELTKEDLDG